jgi:ATPase family associated with various cellular activities (AAA)
VTALLTAPVGEGPERTPATTHAELIRAVVLSRVIRRLDQPEGHTGDLTWLGSYLRLLDPHGEGEPVHGSDPAEVERYWTDRLDAYVFGLDGLEGRSPWLRLAPEDAMLVAAAGLVDDDIRFGSLFAALQAPLRSRRPCIGLLNWLLTETPDEHALVARGERLARRGILAVADRDEPRAEWVVRVPLPIAELLRTGRIDPATLPTGLTFAPAHAFPTPAETWVHPLAAGQVAGLPALLASEALSAVVVRGLGRSGRRTILGSAAGELGWDLLVIDHAAASPEAWQTFSALTDLAQVLPVIRCQPGPDAPLELSLAMGGSRTVGVVAPRTGGLTGDLLLRSVTIDLRPPDPDARRSLWPAAGLDPARDDLDEIADTFLLTPGNIVLAARQLAASTLPVRTSDVRDAVRQLHRHQLEPLAERLEPHVAPIPVLDPVAAEEVDALLLRCRHRERLAAAQATADRGLRALFSGPSGTGKTLTARYLAGCLSLDVYRVNLASVVNKYLGVTERNLDTVFSVAEELGVILLLDEGDALMTRRTDVADANDRYANLETNFLLQRLEAYSGIVLITSNAAGRIDHAFQRRIDITVDFQPPSAEQRWQIWDAHLPPDHQVSDRALTEVARRCPLTGGAIRNVAVHATLLALDARVPADDAALLAALRREYRRTGGTCPL